MEDKLYYEKTNITRVPEVEEAYRHAMDNNYKYYRATTEKGVYYGWENGKCIKAIDGQEWFENHNYNELESVIEPHEALKENVLNEANSPIETDAPHAEINNTSTEENKTDYESLYKETYKLLQIAEEKSEEYQKAYFAQKKELDDIKNAVALIAKEIVEAMEKAE